MEDLKDIMQEELEWKKLSYSLDVVDSLIHELEEVKSDDLFSTQLDLRVLERAKQIIIQKCAEFDGVDLREVKEYEFKRYKD